MILKNKTVVVTGCSSGIGAETARQLKAQGATVIGLDIKEPSENVDQYIPIDLADDASIANAVAQVESKIDALCNIAGVPPTLPPMVQIKVNFFGLRTFTNLMIPKLNQGASIVNFGSIAGMKYMQRIPLIKQLIAFEKAEDGETWMKENEVYGEETYNFSKEAVILWTMKMAPIAIEKGFTIKCVSPGPVKTPILQDFLDTIAKKNALPPTGFEGEPSDIASFVIFLCSEGGRWMNGQNILIDGGLLATRMGAGMGL